MLITTITAGIAMGKRQEALTQIKKAANLCNQQDLWHYYSFGNGDKAVLREELAHRRIYTIALACD